MTPGKAENREKGLPMGSAHSDAMQCESMRLLWGCDCYSSRTVIWTTLTSQYAGLCSSLYPAMKWSSCVPVLSGKKINPHCCSHLIPLLHKLHPSSLMNVQSRYRSPCGSLEAFRWLLRTNAVSSVGFIPWKSLVVRPDTTPHSQQQGWCDGKCYFQNEHINCHQNHSAKPRLSKSTGDLVLCFKLFSKYPDTGNTHLTSNFLHITFGSCPYVIHIYLSSLLSWPSTYLMEF